MSAPLRLADIMQPVQEASCLDFVRFRTALRQHRARCDDNVRQRLASLTQPTQQCALFTDNLRRAQESRMRNLQTCLRVLGDEEERLKDAGNLRELAIVKKEVRMVV